ncbi:hypothetical protein [Tahibacter amnicola]|uniref:Glycosyl hydrolase family 65 n=1 Tax=Tahibacter amnicola TaxID=2976241 RepID=A0ABY6BJD3_9GAMM|nr:hypothetical protein [Tahibacter amnicola]UXI70128.1 hypothetical protein N4264_11005 [Tahibacter amnicola]
MSSSLVRFISTIVCLMCGVMPAAALPDVDVADAWLDADNRLQVSLTNDGDTLVWPGKGGLTIFIDGRAVMSYRLGDLADDAFRYPGGVTTVSTNIRLFGPYRRVGIVVDPHDDIVEAMEVHNSHTHSLLPAPLTGFDLAIGPMLRSSGGELWIPIRNQGNARTPAAHPATLTIRVDDGATRTIAFDAGNILPGGTRWVMPSPAIGLPAVHRVHARLNPGAFLQDLDSVNNTAEAWLPISPVVEEVERIAALPAISAAIVWHNHSGTAVPYNRWTASQRLDLRTAVNRLENGDPAGLRVPPGLPTADTRLIADTDAWRIYVAHVAQSLWVEARGLVPWRLTAMSASDRSLLLDSNHIVQPSLLRPPMYSFYGTVADWSPESSWQFLTGLGLLKSTHRGTVEALTRWMAVHLYHAFGSTPRTEMYAYAGAAPTDRMLYSIDGQLHWTLGCHGTSGLYRAVLRAANIPVMIERDDSFTHTRPIFPSINLAMVHGDDPYRERLRDSGNPLPISVVLKTPAEIAARYIHAPLDCNSTGCNTPAEQWSYNATKDSLSASLAALSDNILEPYVRGGPLELERVLTGTGATVHPLFSPAERSAARTAVEAELRRVGGGSLPLGRDRVLQRLNVFVENTVE